MTLNALRRYPLKMVNNVVIRITLEIRNDGGIIPTYIKHLHAGSIYTTPPHRFDSYLLHTRPRPRPTTWFRTICNHPPPRSCFSFFLSLSTNHDDELFSDEICGSVKRWTWSCRSWLVKDLSHLFFRHVSKPPLQRFFFQFSRKTPGIKIGNMINLVIYVL